MSERTARTSRGMWARTTPSKSQSPMASFDLTAPSSVCRYTMSPRSLRSSAVPPERQVPKKVLVETNRMTPHQRRNQPS